MLGHFTTVESNFVRPTQISLRGDLEAADIKAVTFSLELVSNYLVFVQTVVVAV